MVLFHRPQQAAQHDDAAFRIGLVDRYGLEAPGEGRVLLDVLPIFGPGRRGDGAQRAARKRGLQQVGGVARSGLTAGADQRMRFVDEEDDGGRRTLHLVDDGAQALFELALHRSAGLHQPDIERAETDALQRRWHQPFGDALGETLDDGGLADPGLAGEDRIVLAAPHQHVDDLADFVVAAEDRVGRAGSRLGRQILREPVERRLAFRPGCGVGAGCSRPRQARAIHGAEIFFLRSGPDRPVFGGQHIGVDLVEFGGDADKAAAQIERFERRQTGYARS